MTTAHVYLCLLFSGNRVYFCLLFAGNTCIFLFAVLLVAKQQLKNACAIRRKSTLQHLVYFCLQVLRKAEGVSESVERAGAMVAAALKMVSMIVQVQIRVITINNTVNILKVWTLEIITVMILKM